ncbi:hypothetical protein TNCV_1249871 [Trichonephila clavipes]|nr:hypothetical protein TNCV_1249871 [Trichonephila clavipes]
MPYTIQCRTKIAEIISYDWNGALKWIQSHVESPGNEMADQKAKHGAESSQPEVPSTLRRTKSIISTFIGKYTIVTQKTKTLVQSRVTWREPRLLPTFAKPPGMTFWKYTSTGLAWLLTRPAHSAAMPEWMVTTCSNALDSINNRLTTSSVDTGRFGVEWSRSQARALDK